MVQFEITSQGEAGRECRVRRFPFRIGRAPEAELRLEADGVWDRHAVLHFARGEGFFLETEPGALVSVNGRRTERVRLRNGDRVECGSAKLRFWLAPATQRSLVPRELLTWAGLAGLIAVQIGLLYHLLG